MTAALLSDEASGSSGEAPRFRSGEVLVRFAPGVIDIPAIPEQTTFSYRDISIRDPGVRAALTEIEATQFRLIARRWRSEQHETEFEEYVPMQRASFRDWYLVRFVESRAVDAVVSRLQGEPAVVSVEPNALGTSPSGGYWPSDPGLCTSTCSEPYQWNLNNVGGSINCVACSTGFDIGMEAAWAVQSICKVKVADLDYGADSDHPDLADNLDTALAWDFDGDDSDWEDQHGHGTATAGIIGALHNTQGIAGICGKPEAGLEVVVPLKVFPDPPAYGAASSVVRLEVGDETAEVRLVLVR